MTIKTYTYKYYHSKRKKSMQISLYLKANNNEKTVINLCWTQVKQYENKKCMALNTYNTKEERMKSNEDHSSRGVMEK